MKTEREKAYLLRLHQDMQRFWERQEYYRHLEPTLENINEAEAWHSLWTEWQHKVAGFVPYHKDERS